MRPKAGLFRLLAIGGLIILGVAACSGAATPGQPASTQLPQPTEPATPTSVPSPSPTPTPGPASEWELVGSQTEGSTVTVLLRVFSGIDVKVTLDGVAPNEVNSSAPNVSYVFQSVAAGNHTLVVADVVGHQVTGMLAVPEGTSLAQDIPDWLVRIIKDFESGEAGAPPDFIGRYEYGWETVYYVAPRCCDIFSDLYDVDGNLIAHPDGGITGQGGGRASGFRPVKNAENVIWENIDGSKPSLVLTQALAPVESVEVLILESFPPQYRLNVVSGLPNACFSFAGYYLERQDTRINIRIQNWNPAGSDLGCAEIYRTVETSISLGTEFQPGQAYTVAANEVTETFVAQ